MKKFPLLLAILICGACFLSGCEGDGDDDAPAIDSSANQPADGASGGGSSGDTSADSDEEETSADDTDRAAPAPAPVDANAAFQATVPSGLGLKSKYSVAGRGTVYVLGCNEIPGAVTYVFSCFARTENVATPQAGFLLVGPGDPFEWEVYAINADGYNTQTASAITPM